MTWGRAIGLAVFGALIVGAALHAFDRRFD